MCRLIGISRDAFYKQRYRGSKSIVAETQIIKMVKSVRLSQPRVGTKKVYKELKPELEQKELKCGRDKLFSILRSNYLLVEPKKSSKRTTYSNHQYAVAENQIKQLEISKPNQVFVSDITYIRLKEGFAYLFLETDAYSRKILGYHLSRDLTHHSALLALNMAVSDIEETTDIIHHSDRGCQYCCHEFLNYLNALEMVPSMTDENHCYQNAIAERVNGILKDEFHLDAVFANFNHALANIKKAIKVYNSKRLHWSLNLETPDSCYYKSAA